MSRSGDSVSLQWVDNSVGSVVCFCTLQIAFVSLDIYFGLAAKRRTESFRHKAHSYETAQSLLSCIKTLLYCICFIASNRMET